MFLSDEGPTLKTLNFAFYIGGTPTFFIFQFFLKINTQKISLKVV